MKPPNVHTPDPREEDDPPHTISPRVLHVISLVIVLALILAASSVIIAATDGGIWIVLLIVAISAILVYRWGFHTGADGADSDR
jgi:hypothetical protein